MASAGILVNFFIAFLAVLLFYIFRYFGILSIEIAYIFELITTINLFLATFNLLPFPPADGFSIFSELFLHFKRFLFKVKNIFKSKKESIISYKVENRENTFHIKNIFSNPIIMIIVIFIAVNVFQIIVPYIFSFIKYLYSF